MCVLQMSFLKVVPKGYAISSDRMMPKNGYVSVNKHFQLHIICVTANTNNSLYLRAILHLQILFWKVVIRELNYVLKIDMIIHCTMFILQIYKHYTIHTQENTKNEKVMEKLNIKIPQHNFVFLFLFWDEGGIRNRYWLFIRDMHKNLLADLIWTQCSNKNFSDD